MGEEAHPEPVRYEQFEQTYADGITAHYYRRTDCQLDNLNPIMILGTGRCGTSAVAGMLHRMQVFGGKRMQPPDEHNPKGYYEDLEFAVLADGINQGWMPPDLWKDCVKRLVKERQDFCGRINCRWFIKSVYSLRLWDYYHQVFSEIGVNPAIIYCYRDRDEVFRSMKKTAPYASDDMIYKIIDSRTTFADTVLPYYKYLKVYFQDILDSPKEVALCLAHFLNLKPAQVHFDEAVAFIER